MTIKERMELAEKFGVKDFTIEYTGGGVFVAYGAFTNGTYFSLGADLVVIYDEDEYAAIGTDEYEDGYEWELKHELESYGYDMPQYKYIQLQLYNRCSKGERNCDIFLDIEDEDNE